MFGSRRLAKRSIVGTRITALWQDGRYYPGVIEAQSSDEGSTTGTTYSVRFDDGFHRNIPASEIIGPGFQPITSTSLKRGQKVYITMNGRETAGSVARQALPSDEVIIINVKSPTGDQIETYRKFDEVRLMESRKSARLQDQDTDYSVMADVQISEPKKRTVSHVIDVPAKTHRQRRRNSGDGEDEDVEMMDEKLAAHVLTSLSCSPASPAFPGPGFFKDRDYPNVPHSFQEGYLSSSVASSGFGSGQSERSGPSPPLNTQLSESAPAAISGYPVSTPPQGAQDDGIDLEENVKSFYNDVKSVGTDDNKHKKLMFQCTWKKCGKIHTTVHGIEKHVRTVHLDKDSDSSCSDGEEEFYYTEIEVNVDTVTESFADMSTASSPPPAKTWENSRGVFDHDYQRKEKGQTSSNVASSVPSSGSSLGFGMSTPIPINIPEGQITRSLSWQPSASSPIPLSSSPMRIARPSIQERLQQHQAQSPKTHMLCSPPKGNASHRKPRSEVRKCRKVYGMENRDMWCTQCKWKKACSRFVD